MGNRRALLFFVLAVAFGLTAALLARNALRDRMTPPVGAAPPITAPVVVAKVDLPIAIGLSESQLEVSTWPKANIPEAAVANPSELVGRVLRHPLAKGEPIFESALLPVGSAAGMVAVISDTKRAVSVKVDPVVSVAGFVTPGTRVDVLATVRQGQKPQSKVVLQDITVLAIDQRLEEAKNGEPELVNVVTVEVDPKQAEQLVFAAHEGRLQLALRSPTDRAIVQTAGVSAQDIFGGPRRRVASTGGGRPSERVEVLKGSGMSVRNF